MTRMSRFLARFRKDEEGSATVEFAVYFTVLFIILAATVEIAYMNLRHAMLERSLDIAVRDIRLSTGHIPSYNEVKAQVCENAVVIDQCESNVRLEMVQADPRNFSADAPNTADCINAANDPRPVRNFEHGQDNQLMLIRACLKFKPMIPFTSLGAELNVDDEGYAQLVATSAFVQEPR